MTRASRVVAVVVSGVVALLWGVAAVPVSSEPIDAPPAKVVAEPVEYRDGDAVLEGVLFRDPAAQGKRPGVLVVHAWRGLDAHARAAAERLVGLGYVAFAADVYGKGIRPQPSEAPKESAKYKSDRGLTRSRMKAALEQLAKAPGVDATKLGAIGFCFGGMCVLELARSGADVDAVVSFHGSLDTPTPDDAKNIKGKVLVLHGADDPFVKPEHVEGLLNEMKGAHVDFQLVQYGGAVHSFTDESAGSDPSKGAAYHPVVARRAWAAMAALFHETFTAP